MILISHNLKDYRNINEIYFEPINGVNVISGQNGQGKTNLIESIFLLSGAKSFRPGKDVDLIKKQKDFSIIESEIESGKRKQTLKFSISQKGRNVSHNKGEQKKASTVAGVFAVSVFSPEHLNLVKGTAAERRRFLDTCLMQISKKYLYEIRNYNRLVVQKNSLLKDCRNISAAYDMLDVFDLQLAKSCEVITEIRKDFCESLNQKASERYSEISDNSENLSLRYNSTVFEQDNFGINNVLKIFEQTRKDDIRLGFCSKGPHRDDIEILIADSEARFFASQGQQRTAVLALKLSEAVIMEQVLNEKPVVLLDDVLSELDKNRQQHLLKSIVDMQAFITTCDSRLIEKNIDTKFFNIEKGRVV